MFHIICANVVQKRCRQDTKFIINGGVMNKKKFLFTVLCVSFFALASYLFLYNEAPFKSVSPVSTQAIFSTNAVSASKTGITIVFDLNGVLLGVDAKKAFSEIGLSKILKYSSERNISFSSIEHELTKKVYEVFDAIQQVGKDCEALDPYGNVMPGMMCDWQMGRKSNSELKKQAIAAIQNHPEWFTCDIEKQLVQQIIIKMFTPELLVSTIKIVPEGLRFVEKCKQQGHTLMILSNWDAESFALLQEKLPELFTLFDDLIISGITHQTKPKREAYAPLVERKVKFNEEIIFIDDQKENIDAARALGLRGLLCTYKKGFLGLTSSPDFTTIEKQVADIIAEHQHI